VIILGVDPGTLVTGYGVISTRSNETEAPTKRKSGKTSHPSAFRVIEYGTIESKRIATLPARLEMIFNRLNAVIERTMPDEFAIETAFYHKNIQSTLKLGHARGVAMLSAVLKQLPLGEYAPREVKRAVVGNGNASKEQVEFMVRQMLALDPDDLKLPDAYDALAVAMTHALRINSSLTTGTNLTSSTKAKGKSGKSSWKQFVAQNPDRIR